MTQRVWDLPLRLFHWLLAASVIGAIATGLIGGNWMGWHADLGVMVAGLLVFRLLWGLVGSTYARWTTILRAPFSLGEYLRGQWQQPGHNPLGSLSVLAMLAVLIAQTVTGLLAYDDIALRGPLARLVDTDTSLWLTDIHRLLKNLLMLLIGLHIASIVVYQLRGRKLVQAMLHGRDEQMAPEQTARGGGLAAFVLVLAISLGTLWALQQAPQWLAPPKPASPPPALSW